MGKKKKKSHKKQKKNPGILSMGSTKWKKSM
jgi:hypothetical protein